MSDRERFYNIINQYDCLQPYWDQKKHEIKLKEFEQALGRMSTGEAILARFMANVWFGEERYFFNLIDAAGTLGGRYKAVIIDWLSKPYWP